MTRVEFLDAIACRVRALVDYLITQPPKRMAMNATEDFAWWALRAGADHPSLVNVEQTRDEARENTGAD